MQRRQFLTATLAGAAALAAPSPVVAELSRPVRFGLTAVVVRENFPFFQRWSNYLLSRLGRPVDFVLRRTYREIMEMLETGEVDFAWICGYPLVRHRDTAQLDLLTVPVFEGSPRYQSYVIVHRDAPYRDLEEMKGRVFAYSDPDSNSGYLAPRSMLLNRGHSADRFFRLTFFTYSHAETIEAVSDRFADGGAVDSYVWEYLTRTNPGATANTRILTRSDRFGFPPLVARARGDRRQTELMRRALMEMQDDSQGRALLADLALDRFGPPDMGLYDGIRRMAEQVSAARAGGAP